MNMRSLALAMPLVALDDFEALGQDDPFYATLARITKENRGLWSADAEKFILANAPPITQ